MHLATAAAVGGVQRRGDRSGNAARRPNSAKWLSVRIDHSWRSLPAREARCGRATASPPAALPLSAQMRQTLNDFAAAALVLDVRVVELEAFVQSLAREVELGAVEIRQALRVDHHRHAVALEAVVFRLERRPHIRACRRGPSSRWCARPGAGRRPCRASSRKLATCFAAVSVSVMAIRSCCLSRPPQSPAALRGVATSRGLDGPSPPIASVLLLGSRRWPP